MSSDKGWHPGLGVGSVTKGLTIYDELLCVDLTVLLTKRGKC